MLAPSLLQECYGTSTFPVYHWPVTGLGTVSNIFLAWNISLGKPCCCCPISGAPHHAHVWPGHQLPQPAWACSSHLSCWPKSSCPELVYIILTAYLWPVYISLFLRQECVLAETTFSGICTLTYLQVQVAFWSQSLLMISCFLHHHIAFLHIWSSSKQLYQMHVLRATPPRGSFTHNCSMTLILLCLFNKYLPCHTLALLARKLRSAGFKLLIPKHLPPTGRPIAKVPPNASPEEFVHHQAMCAQMTFECSFSWLATWCDNFHITCKQHL